MTQLTPQFVVLSPPDQIVLEIAVTRYTAITWLVNGTDMHSFERVSLENFSKRFIVVNTSESDAGTYEVDVHSLNGTVNTAFFYVLPFSEDVLTCKKISSCNIWASMVTSVLHMQKRCNTYMSNLSHIDLLANTHRSTKCDRLVNI